MPSEAIDLPLSAVRPRPGVVKALGIANIVFSVLSVFLLLYSLVWIGIAWLQPGEMPAPDNPLNPAAQAAPGNGGTPLVINPFIGMDDPVLVRFFVVDTLTSLVFTAIMFATGIGLINLAGWGAWGWKYLAWAKIARLWLFWGYFIVAVAPAFSDAMARSALAMVNPSGLPGKLPTLGELTRIYSIMNLIVGVGMIVFGTIYPALSIWLLSRPGVKEAVRKDPPALEPELS
jgi:hypothetical protein